MKLSTTNVTNLMEACLTNEHDEKIILIEGVVCNYGFNQDKLNEHEEDIRSMLDELPDPFHATSGGGYSFPYASFNKNDEQWGEQRDAASLLCLGMGVKRVALLLPRTMWHALPGSVPYYVVEARKNMFINKSYEA